MKRLNFGDCCQMIGKKVYEAKDKPEFIVPALVSLVGLSMFAAGAVVSYDTGKHAGIAKGLGIGQSLATSLYAGEPRMDVPFWHDIVSLSECPDDFKEVILHLKDLPPDTPVRITMITQNV